MKTTCSSRFRRTPTTPPRRRPSPTLTAVFRRPGDREPVQRDPRGRQGLAVWTRHLCSRQEQPAAPHRRRLGSRRSRPSDRTRRLRHVLRPDAGRNVRSECAGVSITTRFARIVPSATPRSRIPAEARCRTLCAVSTPVRAGDERSVCGAPMAALERRRAAAPLLPRSDRRGLRRLGRAIICFDMSTSTSRSPRISTAKARRPNLVRPFLGYDAIVMRETTARSRYHGLLASFRHEAGRAGSATVNYTFSRTKADATYDNSGDRRSSESAG